MEKNFSESTMHSFIFIARNRRRCHYGKALKLHMQKGTWNENLLVTNRVRIERQWAKKAQNVRLSTARCCKQHHQTCFLFNLFIYTEVRPEEENNHRDLSRSTEISLPHRESQGEKKLFRYGISYRITRSRARQRAPASHGRPPVPHRSISPENIRRLNLVQTFRLLF